MRTVVLLALLGAVSACGGSATIHYDTKPALDCLQRTNSTFAHRNARSIFVLFASEDGMSAVEPVFVSFGPATVTGAVPAALGATSKQPTWRERRSDARVSGYGPYEPPVAIRRHVPDRLAKAAVRKLGADVRVAIDNCLKQNER